MRPDEKQSVPQSPVPANQQTPVRVREDRYVRKEATTNIVRGQIDTIYRNDPNATMVAPVQPTPAPVTVPAPAPVVAPTQQSVATSSTDGASCDIKAGPGAVNMQERLKQQATEPKPEERDAAEPRRQVKDASWDKYHSAWQSYYQQYYERYYVGQVNQVKKTIESTPRTLEPAEPASISDNEAMSDLRDKLRAQINEKAQKVRKSRHFLPIAAAVCVMLMFVFLQYNRFLFATVDAYISPGSLDPSTLIVDPQGLTPISDQPRLIVPKISVDVPIILTADASSETSLNTAMDQGVAWFNVFGASAKPGEMGNFVVSGHSSNDWLDKGDYKFIFARLEQLNEGDTIYVNYNGIRYVYAVSRKEVVKPTDVSALAVGTEKPQITLLTCTPLGTAINRLLVFADQVSPDPNSASAVADTADTKPAQMPANSPTFIQRLFGGR